MATCFCLLINSKHSCFSLLLLFISCFSYSQDTINLSREISTLHQTWNSYREEIVRPVTGHNYEAVNTLFKIRNTQATAVALDNQVRQAEADLLHSDPGITANVSFLNNFNPSLNLDDDNLIYQRRLQTGVYWHILGNGFVQNRYDEKQLLNEITINNYLAPSQAKENSYSINWNIIIYLFNKEKIKLLDLRAGIISELEEEAERLHFSKYLTREAYLKILSRKAEIEALQRIYADYNGQFGSTSDSLQIDPMSLPLLDVNYVNVFSVLNPAVKDSISKLYLENLKLDASVIRDIDVNTGLRYNFYDLIVPGYRSFFSLVLNVSMPLPLNHKRKTSLSEFKAQQAMFKIESQFDGRQKELLNECYEYRYKLKQYISFHQKFLLYEELVRKMNASMRMDNIAFNPIDGITLLDDMLSVKMELVDLRQSLYLKLLRIFTKSGAQKPEEMSQELTIPNYFDLQEATQQSVYVWSGVYKLKSLDFLSEYITFNKFNHVVLSLNSNDTSRNNNAGLIKRLNENPVKRTYEAMVGDNHLINEDVTKKLGQLFADIPDGTYHYLHLDVEPQTFADWGDNKEQYLQQYLNMLSEAKTFCNQHQLKLAVSIPLYYPEETVKQIFSVCDLVYFMAYENTKPDYVQRKIKPFESYTDQLVLAIRYNDFPNRIMMEKYMIDSYQQSGIQRFALHDLSGLIKMDERNIGK